MASPSEALNRQKSDTVLEAAATSFEPLHERSDFAGASMETNSGTGDLAHAANLPHTAITDDSAATEPSIHKPVSNPSATMRLTRMVTDRGMPRYSRTTLQ